MSQWKDDLQSRFFSHGQISLCQIVAIEAFFFPFQLFSWMLLDSQMSLTTSSAVTTPLLTVKTEVSDTTTHQGLHRRNK